MCEISIHYYAFEPVISHAYVLYSNLLSAQTLGCVKKEAGGGKYIYINIYIISNSLVLDVCLVRCFRMQMHACITFGLKGSHL